MIVTGAWWDYVDSLASHEVGFLVRAYPDELKPIMLKWAKSANLWKRRTAILCQLSAKDDLDLPFLYRVSDERRIPSRRLLSLVV